MKENKWLRCSLRSLNLLTKSKHTHSGQTTPEGRSIKLGRWIKAREKKEKNIYIKANNVAWLPWTKCSGEKEKFVDMFKFCLNKTGVFVRRTSCIVIRQTGRKRREDNTG